MKKCNLHVRNVNSNYAVKAVNWGTVLPTSFAGFMFVMICLVAAILTGCSGSDDQPKARVADVILVPDEEIDVSLVFVPGEEVDLNDLWAEPVVYTTTAQQVADFGAEPEIIAARLKPASKATELALVLAMLLAELDRIVPDDGLTPCRQPRSDITFDDLVDLHVTSGLSGR